MYTILLRDKRLIATNKERIHQRDSLMDTFKFLIPKEYEGNDLTNFEVIMKYISQANVPKMELLDQETELYKDEYIVCKLPIDSQLTMFAGNVNIRLTFASLNDDDELVEFHTDGIDIDILPTPDAYTFVDGTGEAYVDELIANKTNKSITGDIIDLDPDSGDVPVIDPDDDVIDFGP